MTVRIFAGERSVRLAISEQSDVGECRRTAKRLAGGCEFDEGDVGRVCILATELANNVVRHAGGGEMLMQVLDDGMQRELEILALDRGPGMADVERCLRDGYSTAGTPGTGLGAIARLSTIFEVFSVPSRGTVVLSRTRAGTERGARDRGPLFGALSVALAGEIECGDSWRIAAHGTTVSVMVADGLGHGLPAAAAARAAARAFAERPFDDPAKVMQNLHQALTSSRGAVAACAQLQPEAARVEYAGVGNIHAALVGKERSRGMVSHNGMLGAQAPRIRQFGYDWPREELVIMHSDGLSARWNLTEQPGLCGRHPAIIAAVLYREWARKHDDATVVVVRYTP